MKGSEEENGKGREKAGVRNHPRRVQVSHQEITRAQKASAFDLIKQGCENNVVKQMSKS